MISFLVFVLMICLWFMLSFEAVLHIFWRIWIFFFLSFVVNSFLYTVIYSYVSKWSNQSTFFIHSLKYFFVCVYYHKVTFCTITVQVNMVNVVNNNISGHYNMVSMLLIIFFGRNQNGKGRWKTVTIKFMQKTLSLRETSDFLRITWTSYA